MKCLPRLIAAACVALIVSTMAPADQVLLKDDFSGLKLSPVWEQNYPEKEKVFVKLAGGALDVRYGTCWNMRSRFSPTDHPGGLSATVDMRLYPMPGYEWKPSSEFHPFGLQNNKGGVGYVYARFTLKDADDDKLADALEFQTRNADGNRFTTLIPNYNPRTDPKAHRFRIVWKPHQTEAYFDGKPVATHPVSIVEPLWLVGRNELGGTILDNVELRALPVASAADGLRIEAESPRLVKPASAKLVADAAVSGGKAVVIQGENKKLRSDLMTAAFPAQPAGTYRLNVRMKTENAYDVGRNWRVDILAGGGVLAHAVAHGYYFKDKKGYVDFPATFDLSDADTPPRVEMYWALDTWYPACTSKPVVYLDCIELTKLHDLPVLDVVQVWPGKIRYLRDETGSVTVKVRNTTARAQQGRLRVNLIHDLRPPTELATRNLSLKAGELREIKLPLRFENTESAEYGYEVEALAIVNGKVVDAGREYFCVANNPFAVSTHQHYFSNEADPRDWRLYTFHNRFGRIFNEPRVTDEDAVQGALQAREAYVTCWEFYSWSPGGCIDMAPKEDLWIDGDYGLRVKSKHAIQKAAAALRAHGIGCITYNIPYGQGLVSPKLLQERPEWFILSKDTSDFTMYGYDVAVLNKQRAFAAEHDLTKLKTNNGYITPQPKGLTACPFFGLNFGRQDVVDYVTDQMIASIEMFGWDGVRWDCGHLNTGTVHGVWQPFLDFYGKPLCKSPEEMERQTVANIRRFKSRIREKYPHFAFGTNYGSIGETRQYPAMTRELCRGGGWLLDEIAGCTYDDVQSPYRFWDKYYDVMADQGDYVASQGGHYFPFSPGRFGSAYPADRIYNTVFMLGGHGHPHQCYRNSCFITGDPAQLLLRFGRFYFDPKLSRVKDPGEFIRVTSATPVWWEKSVQRRVTTETETWVVHLINPPVSKHVYEDKTSALPAPISNISVRIPMPPNRKAANAWALTSESWKSGESAKTQAVPLNIGGAGAEVTVTVPEILIWKTLVFEFK